MRVIEVDEGYDFRDNGQTCIRVYDHHIPKDFNPKYWCRLIERAEEMEGNIREFKKRLDKNAGCAGYYTIREVYKGASEILDYLDNKPEEMVTLKMSWKSAEKANLLLFEVKER